MENLFYPSERPYLHRYGYAKTMSHVRPDRFKNLNFARQSFIISLLSLLIGLFAVKPVNAQGSCPNSNCTSGDMTITKVELVDATTLGPLPNTCVPGQQTVAVKLKVTLDATAATRYGFLLVGDLQINGQSAGKIYQCYGEDFTQGPHTKILDQIIQWPCGSTLALTNVYTAWDNQTPSTAICT